MGPPTYPDDALCTADITDDVLGTAESAAINGRRAAESADLADDVLRTAEPADQDCSGIPSHRRKEGLWTLETVC